MLKQSNLNFLLLSLSIGALYEPISLIFQSQITFIILFLYIKFIRMEDYFNSIEKKINEKKF